MSCKWIDPEAVAQRFSIEKGVLRNFGKLTGKHLCQSLCNFIKKETLAQLFSDEFSEISENTFSYRTPLVAASGGPKLLAKNLFSCIHNFWYCQDSNEQAGAVVRGCSVKMVLLKVSKNSQETPVPEPLFY